ncbi:MAG: hypothetical protein E6J21_02835 [Chloroflexota bacterium]|nr:MAG: hypothetical protein E6J21_02835 [Chloroflexota bacterium]
MTRDELLAAAREAALRAYCPYSHFRVGAALLAGDKLYTGVNIEISSYGLTLCAERSALALADLAPEATIYIDGATRDFSVPDLLPFAFEL